MGLSDAVKRLFGGAAGTREKTVLTFSSESTKRRVIRDGVEVTDPAEMDSLFKKIEALGDAAAASASTTTMQEGPLTVSETHTTRIIDGPEDLGDPAVRAAVAGVIEELRANGLGDAASGMAEMLAQAEGKSAAVPVGDAAQDVAADAADPARDVTADEVDPAHDSAPGEPKAGAPSAPTPPTPPGGV